MKPGFIIPVYRHGKSACSIAEHLASSRLPVILVDDGNDEETRLLLSECAEKTQAVVLIRLEKNSGKGAAAIKGFEKADELGLTHVLLIDADGQHDISMTDFFLKEAFKYPDKIICGYPVFDETAPKSRVKGRKISNLWAAIVTLSLEFKDVLCGFRVYPVRQTLRVTKYPFLDMRMGFDTEILIRLYWDKVYPEFYPVKVRYYKDGISNFRVVRDNIRISFMFSRLFICMLFLSPILLIRKIKRGTLK